MNFIELVRTRMSKVGSGLRNAMTKLSSIDYISRAGTWARQRGQLLHQSMRKHPVRWRNTALIAGIVVVAAGSGVYAADRYERYVAAHTYTLYEVTLDGQKLGLVSDPGIVESFILERYKQAQSEHPDMRMELEYGEIDFEEQAIYQGEAEDSEVLAQLTPEIRSYAVAVEIRIDGELIGYVKNQAEADELLNRIKQPYDSEEEYNLDKGLVRIASADTEDDASKLLDKQVEFVEEVEEQFVEVQPDQLSDPEELLERIQTGGIEPIAYVVQEGDTIYDISRKHNVSSEVIYRNNTWIVNDMLHPGDVLNLTVMQPLLSVQVTKKIEKKEEIPFPIEYESDPNMLEGQTKVITPGVTGERIVTIEETTINGMLASSHELQSVVTKEPTAAKYLRGTKSVSGIDDLVQKLLGIPYVWGGTTTSGFDCSGFTRYVMAKYGVDLPRTSASQADAGTQVAKKDLRKGDLVFFHTFGPAGTISHVGIYMGNGKIANALSTKVQINDLNDDYFSKRYITARRVLSDEQYRAISK